MKECKSEKGTNINFLYIGTIFSLFKNVLCNDRILLVSETKKKNGKRCLLFAFQNCDKNTKGLFLDFNYKIYEQIKITFF
jgi:hypothetical protein